MTAAGETTVWLCDDEYWMAKKASLSPERVAELCAKADGVLTEPELSVTQKTVPSFTGNPHDYVSLSKYDWPNPDTADGLPWIQKDGEPNPDYEKYDIIPLMRLCHRVGLLAAAGRLSGRLAYSEKAGRLLRCWFLDPATAMTPHLKYAQFVPGHPGGSSWGLIDSHFFCELLEAVACLPDSPGWTRKDRQALRSWFVEYFLWLIGDPLPVKEETAPTNHGTWYDAQFVTIALFLGQPELAKRQIREKSIPRLSVQFLNNGMQPFEVSRTHSLGYSLFNLAGWCRLAAYAHRLGMELWRQPSNDGATLQKAFRFLLPHLKDGKPWAYLQLRPVAPRSVQRFLALVQDFLEPIEGFIPGLDFPCLSAEA